jgi:hypothetical protein
MEAELKGTQKPTSKPIEKPKRRNRSKAKK